MCVTFACVCVCVTFACVRVFNICVCVRACFVCVCVCVCVAVGCTSQDSVKILRLATLGNLTEFSSLLMLINAYTRLLSF